MFNTTDLKKNPEGIHFDQSLDISELLLSRNPEILSVKDVTVKGLVNYDDGLFLLNYDLNYKLTLPSSRSMEPVELEQGYFVSEVFIEPQEVDNKKELVEDELVLVLEGTEIDLAESVVDNILLNIPLKVLTDQESQSDAMPSGHDWTVMTESQYQALQEEKQAANSPFAALDGLFDED